MAIFRFKHLLKNPTFFRIWLVLGFLLYALFAYFMSDIGHPGDINFWTTWARFLAHHSLPEIYQTPCDYLPLYLYVLKIYAWLQTSAEGIERNIHLLKNFTLIFDFLTAFLVANLAKKNEHKLLIFIAILGSIAMIYNTYFWAQVDAIHTFFGLWSLLLIHQKKWSIALPILLIAINFKLQSILILPVALIIIIQDWNGLKYKIIQGITFGLMLQLLIISPFILSGTMTLFFKTIAHPFLQESTVSFAAANFWFLVNWVDIYGIADISTTDLFAGLSLKTWGSIMFLISGLFFMLILAYKHFKYKTQISLENTLALAALITLLAFFLSTGMHERYSHLALPLVVSWSVLKNKYLPTILILIAYFLNLDLILNHFHVFADQTLPGLIQALALLYLCVIYLIANDFIQGLLGQNSNTKTA